jgi:hypothetical protein
LSNSTLSKGFIGDGDASSVERSSIRRSWKTGPDRQLGQDEEKTMNMVPMVGERLRSILTGRLYQVRMFTELFAVLEGEDPSNRVYTEIGNLASFYEQVETEDDPADESLSTGLRPPSHGVGLGITRGEEFSGGGFHP